MNIESKSNLYDGHVTIKFKQGSSVYKTMELHNAGYAEFFEYMLKCTLGMGSYTDRPALLYIYNGGTLLFNFGMQAHDVSNINRVTTPASADITISFLIGDTFVGGKTITKLVLAAASSKPDDMISYASIDNLNITVGADTNLEIDWKLSISNGAN